MSPMRRIMSFRDFDWTLVRGRAVLCTISVLEIYSATLHTKYVGFHTKQIYWILGGVDGDVPLFADRLPQAHRLGSVGIRCLPGGAGRGQAGRGQGAGRQALDQDRADALSAIGMGEAGPDSGGGRYFANLGGKNLTWKEIFKAFALVGVPMLLVLSQPDMGTTLTYTPVLIAGLFLGGINLRQALILITAGLVLVVGAWNSGKVLKPYQKARLTGLH